MHWRKPTSRGRTACVHSLFVQQKQLRTTASQIPRYVAVFVPLLVLGVDITPGYLNGGTFYIYDCHTDSTSETRNFLGSGGLEAISDFVQTEVCNHICAQMGLWFNWFLWFGPNMHIAISCLVPTTHLSTVHEVSTHFTHLIGRDYSYVSICHYALSLSKAYSNDRRYFHTYMILTTYCRNTSPQIYHSLMFFTLVLWHERTNARCSGWLSPKTSTERLVCCIMNTVWCDDIMRVDLSKVIFRVCTTKCNCAIIYVLSIGRGIIDSIGTDHGECPFLTSFAIVHRFRRLIILSR